MLSFVNHRNSRGRVYTAAAAMASLSVVALTMAGCGSGNGTAPAPVAGSVTRDVVGPSQTVSGVPVSTWARLTEFGVVEQVGVNIPFALIQSPPGRGAGPSGAAAVVDFPRVVKAQTYLDHFEMHWEQAGHPPAFFSVPHFDLHFYSITPNQVRAIGPVDTVAPSASRLPAGYTWSGQSVPEMGVHATNNADLGAFAGGAPFQITMVTGFNQGVMHFVEPMITRQVLLTKQTLTRSVPVPAQLGRATRYPTTFRATYDAATNSYRLVFSDFIDKAN